MTNITGTQISRSTVEEALDIAGLYDYTIREDYSGRGMYGARCFGIVFDGSGVYSLAAFAAALGEMVGEQQEYDEPDLEQGFAVELMKRASTDSMGRDSIVYFPGVTLTD